MPQTMGDVKTSVLTPQGVMTVDVGKDECWRKTGETALVSLRGGRGGYTWWEGGWRKRGGGASPFTYYSQRDRRFNY